MNTEITEVEGKKAFDLHQDLLMLKRRVGSVFLRMGSILKEIRDGGHFGALGFENFQEYISGSDLGFKRRTAYYYIEIYELFVLRFGCSEEDLVDAGYERLISVKSQVKELPEGKESSEKVRDLLMDAKELRPADFSKKYKDEEKQKGFEAYLAPPEYIRCPTCGRWKIIVPVSDLCFEGLLELKKAIDKQLSKNDPTTRCVGQVSAGQEQGGTGGEYKGREQEGTQGGASLC